MIAIFTDFGIQGPYLGQMKAALYALAPHVPVVDVFPDLPAFDIQAAAYLLPAYSQYLPQQCICLCVVDPGVGSARRAVLVQSGGRWFVGPDNGLFSVLISRDVQASCREIDWKPVFLSNSFHGRDWFAPVAANLATGQAFASHPLQAEQLVNKDWPDDLDRIVYVDAFGNALTGYRAECLSPATRLVVGAQEISRARTFSDVEPGTAFWYENSNGLAEISVNQGSAVERLNLSVATRVRIRN